MNQFALLIILISPTGQERVVSAHYELTYSECTELKDMVQEPYIAECPFYYLINNTNPIKG